MTVEHHTAARSIGGSGPRGGGDQRQPRIDIARGFAICLVVASHNTVLASRFPELIGGLFLFHVPAFFLISGYLARPGTTTTTLARKLLLTGGTFAVGLAIVKLLIRGGNPLSTVGGLLWATGATLPSSQLWFLPLLFLTLIALQPLIQPGNNQAKQLGLLALLAVLSWVAQNLPEAGWAESLRQPGVLGSLGWPWSIDLLPLSLFFCLAGHLIARRMVISEWPLWWLPAGMSLTAVLFVIGTRTDMNLRILDPLPLSLLAGIAGALALLAASRCLVGSLVGTGLAALGVRTMSILLLHVLIQNAVIKAFGGAGTGTGFFGLAAGITGPALLSITWQRLSSRIGGVRP